MDTLVMMFGYDVDGVNQSLAPQLTITRSAVMAAADSPFDGGDISSGSSTTAASPAGGGGFEDFPYAELLKNEWWNRNISRMLNISEDNLTSLLTAAQEHRQQQDRNEQQLENFERQPVGLVVTLTVFYALIFVAGVLGNLITCIVISRNKFMHTATNFYLFNLAVSDLILLLSGMPHDLYTIWHPLSYPFTDVLCVMTSVLSETAANATVLTITAFTVERYIAICHPFRQHTMSKLSRAIKFIFAIWITAFLLALPQAMQFSVVVQDGTTSCTMQNDFFAHVFAVSGFIFFGGPMTAICVLYVLIGVKLKRSRLLQTVPRRCYDVQRGISAQTRVIRMLVAVAVAFFICWAPFHAQRLMAAYGSTAHIESELFNKVFRVLDYTSGVLYFLSTCINPLLYNIMSHKFREAFKVTLARHFGLATRYQTPNHIYSAIRRQNGSMRLQTTDSMRTTTTTTTTINSGSSGPGGGNTNGGSVTGCNNKNCRSASMHRHHRCIMPNNAGVPPAAGIGVGAGVGRGSLMSLASRNDIYTGRSSSLRDSLPNKSQGGPPAPQPIAASALPQHRLLQTQISQLSSVGDANSLLEEEGTLYQTHAHPHPNTGRLKESRHRPTSLRYHSDCDTAVSQDWLEQADAERYAHNEAAAMMLTKPVAPPLEEAPMAGGEVQADVPSRSRLKLSRIITRRDGDDGSSALGRPARGPHTTLETLTEKFRRKKRRKLPANRELPEESTNSNSSASVASPTGLGDSVACSTTPTSALMKIVYPATAVPSALDANLRSEIANVGRRSAQPAYGGHVSPSAL